MVGAHYFECSALSKKWLHNQIVDTQYVTACTVADYCSLIQNKNDVLHKPTNVWPNYPTVCSLDITLQKVNGLFGIDITTTSVALRAKIPHNQEKRTATLHHQKEMYKWRGTSRANKSQRATRMDQMRMQ
eukprot:6229743-Ditylum_brightwellii.AAC.1